MGSRVYSLDIRDEAGVELKKAKHPSSHHTPDSGLTFIGKRKGSDVDQVFHLPYTAVQEIQSKVK